jgi:hypothetical protein
VLDRAGQQLLHSVTARQMSFPGASRPEDERDRVPPYHVQRGFLRLVARRVALAGMCHGRGPFLPSRLFLFSHAASDYPAKRETIPRLSTEKRTCARLNGCDSCLGDIEVFCVTLNADEVKAAINRSQCHRSSATEWV